VESLACGTRFRRRPQTAARVGGAARPRSRQHADVDEALASLQFDGLHSYI
jgi:hypothetical protein